MAKSGSASVPWPFAHKQVGLNTDTDLIKIVAMITMFIDHAGAAVFKSNIMRIIGRIAFPLYAYCIAVGCVYTRDRLRYLSRVVMGALISQPLYVVALNHTNSAMQAVTFKNLTFSSAIGFYVESWHDPSIFLTLILGMLFIWTIADRNLMLTLALALLTWRIRSYVDYGVNGVLLIVLFYLFCNKWWLSLPVMTAFMVRWGSKGMSYQLFGARFGIQMFALLALPFIYLPTGSKIRLNKHVFYLFYPVHCAVIILMQYVLGMK